jgi:hypothetical protein
VPRALHDLERAVLNRAFRARFQPRSHFCLPRQKLSL